MKHYLSGKCKAYYVNNHKNLYMIGSMLLHQHIKAFLRWGSTDEIKILVLSYNVRIAFPPVWSTIKEEKYSAYGTFKMS